MLTAMKRKKTNKAIALTSTHLKGRILPYCSKCGEKVKDEDKFCTVYSAPVTEVVSTNASQHPPPPSSQYQNPPYRRKTHRGRNIAIVCILILTVAFGFYYYTGIQELKANLVDVGLLNAGITSAQIEVVVDVQNPSLLPIYVSNGGFTIYVNNQQLGYGSLGSFTVGGNSNQRVSVIVSFSYIDVGTTIVNLITEGGTVDVRLDGSLSTFIVSVSFSTTLYNVKFT
jgi:LEA14-like dessication related protein